MSDAKRTPYREKAPVRGPAERRPRGPRVTRAADPEQDTAPLARRDERPEPPNPDAGIFSGLVSPHPSSTPGEWWAQTVLTLIGLPLIASTFVCVGWLDVQRTYGEVVELRRAASRPLSMSHPIAWVFGSLPIGLGCFASEAHEALAVAAIGVPFVALLARRVLRKRIVERDALRALLARAKD